MINSKKRKTSLNSSSKEEEKMIDASASFDNRLRKFPHCRKLSVRQESIVPVLVNVCIISRVLVI